MKNIHSLRDAANLTQEQLAEVLGVDRTTITKWESGKAKPRYDMLPKIAAALKCSIADFFKEE